MRLPPDGIPGLVDGHPAGPRAPPAVEPPFEPPPAFPADPPLTFAMFLSLLAPTRGKESLNVNALRLSPESSQVEVALVRLPSFTRLKAQHG